MKTDKIYFFISFPIALVFWLILNMMFSAAYFETFPKELAIEEMFTSTIFIVMMAFALIELILIWKWVIPTAKQTGNHLIAYVFPEIPLSFGFITAVFMQSITPYFYFIPVWLIGMGMVYREIYSMEP